MHVPAARLCFVDKVPEGSDGKDISGAQPKGYLDLWGVDEPGYEGFNATGSGVNKYNYQLWGYFNKDNPGKEQEQITKEIFEEWYNEQTSSIKGQQSTIKNYLKGITTQ